MTLNHAAPSITRRVPYQPGLDGLRAFALIPMLLFHLEVGGFNGGMFTVSLFFTMSGYLITQLLAAEIANSGRIDLIAFWGRRARRLLPAAALCLAAVLILGIIVEPFANSATKGDLIAGVFNVSNWRFAAAGQSYDEIFQQLPSPLAHFWSLAIEEQFYFALPLVAAIVARWRPKMLAVVLGAGAALSLLAVVLTESNGLSYYGTHTRAFELLAGSLLGLALPLDRPFPKIISRAAPTASSLAVAVFVVLLVVGKPTDSWVYDWGLSAFSLVSALLIIGSCLPTPLHQLLITRPMVAIGRLSYGIYVFHWPLFRLFTAERMGFDGWRLGMLRLGVTAMLAIISWRLVEGPIREQRFAANLRQPQWLYAGVVATLALGAATAPGVDAEPVDLAGIGIDNAPVLFDAPIEPSQSATTLAVAAADAAFDVDATTTSTKAREIVSVLVVGNQPQLVSAVAEQSTDDVVVTVVDRSDPLCPVLPIDYAAVPTTCLATSEVLDHRDEFDLVVVGTGLPDRLGLPADTINDQPARALAYGLLNSGIDRLSRHLVGGPPVVLVDTIASDAANYRLADLAALNPDVTMVTGGARTTLRLAIEAIDPRSAPGVNVLVVGDSTSFGVAAALSRVPDGGLRVLWGGGQNCPFAHPVQVRWWPGAEFDMGHCPSSARGWPELVASFDPDVVLVVASLPAQAEQRYVADGPWIAPGAPEYVSAHETEMASLQQLLAPLGAVTIVANAPVLNEGAFSGSEMATARRRDAWNAQIAALGSAMGIRRDARLVVNRRRCFGRWDQSTRRRSLRTAGPRRDRRRTTDRPVARRHRHHPSRGDRRPMSRCRCARCFPLSVDGRIRSG